MFASVVWFNRSVSRITSGCALAGASALLLADTVARLALAAAELPIGVVTATLGAPVFIWLLLKAEHTAKRRSMIKS
ncbi:iron chelate uptake ABC transporter family permease subunit [Escherichia coli]